MIAPVNLDKGDVKGFLGTLEDFGCAKRLVYFRFQRCKVAVEGVGILAELLGRDVSPALERLEISGTPDLEDAGVVALAEGLLRARQMMLTNLVLKNVGMADEGMAALASLVSQGLMKKLKVLNITNNKALTHEGFRCLARAIDKYGLPMLETFRMQEFWMKVTLASMCAITHALIKGCPRLEEIDHKDTDQHQFYDSGRRFLDAITGMLKAAGRVEGVDVIYEKEEESWVDSDEDE